MGLTETLLFYHLIGLSVAVAVWSQSECRPVSERSFRAATAIPFWPLYLPILLTRDHTSEPPQGGSASLRADELATKIDEVDRELEAALSSLDGWAEQALSHERERIAELRSAWNWQASRIREMDEVLRGFCGSEAPREDSPPGPGERIHRSVQSRRQNMARLREVREQAYEDFTATLARVRELISLIHLAKFTGAPASRADELVQEIAASVEGLSEVAGWRDPPGQAASPHGARPAAPEVRSRAG